jgi:glycosyltransferase involved in cell wall biosynthesis
VPNLKLHYIANVRLPTEKAHGLQIVQNCEAFAQNGAQVKLWVAARTNTAEMQAIPDLYAHYGVTPNFALQRLPTLDLLPLVPGRDDRLAQAIFALQLVTFTLSALIMSLFTAADVIYSRDPLVLWVLSWVTPKRKLVYEAHQLAAGKLGSALQRRVVQQCGTVIATTARLRDDLLALADGVQPQRFMVAHDGVRAARFAELPSQADARHALGWPQDAFIVGYVGRLHTMGKDKGVATLLEALQHTVGASLAIVGGPTDMAEALRDQWLAANLPATEFLYAGQVAPERVPLCMRAFDVCVMPLPFTPHFAYHASPLKLFEYMASGQAVVVSDLPAWADVVRDGENALLFPAGDVTALAQVLARLRADPALRARLGATARAEALTLHTWAARATRILAHIRQAA